MRLARHDGTLFDPVAMAFERTLSCRAGKPQLYLCCSVKSSEGTEKSYLYVAPAFAFLSPPYIHSKRCVPFDLSLNPQPSS